MAYDPRHKVHVLFGSQFDDDQHTWLYDLNANTWSALETDLLPPTAQNDAVLTYDASARVIVAVAKNNDGQGRRGETPAGNVDSRPRCEEVVAPQARAGAGPNQQPSPATDVRAGVRRGAAGKSPQQFQRRFGAADLGVTSAG
jgi:hypothetical protein